MQFPNIDPVIIKIAGPFAIRWYAIPYILCALLVRSSIIRSNKIANFCSPEDANEVTASALIGLICGARLGYALFYDPMYYARYPMEILMIWKGGLSFHGGFIGLVAAVLTYCKQKNINSARVLDSLALSIPFGLFLGRIANFINAELYGRETKSWIGMVFPTDPYQIPRHPSQLYEAALEGLALGCVALVIAFKRKVFDFLFSKDYAISAIMLLLYCVFRFICEFFREPDSQYGLIFGAITMGQILSAVYILPPIFYLSHMSRKWRGGVVAK